MENEYLVHYGVPGMKWGVRRELGKKARSGYRMSRYVKRTGKQLNKLDKKIQSFKDNGLDVPRHIEKRRKNIGQANSDFKKAMNNAYKNLSEKDIAQGKRAVISRRIAGALLLPFYTIPIAFGGADLASYNRYKT